MMSGPPKEESYFIPQLEAARGVAALMVALYHCFVAFDGRDLHFPSLWELETTRQWVAKLAMMPFNGGAAVSFFFVLSGFVLSRSLRRKPRLSASEFWKFLLSRVFRIYPVCVASTLVFAIVYRLGHHFVPTFPVFSVAEILRNLLLIDEKFPIDGPLWSAALELIVAPLIFVAALSQRKGLLALIALLAITVAMLALPGYFQSYYLIWISRFSFMFVFGVLLADIPAIPLGPRNINALFAIALCTLLIPRALFKYDAAPTLLLEGISSAVIISILAVSRSGPNVILLSWPARWLGRVSFSFYGFHGLAIVVIVHVFATSVVTHDPFVATACIAIASIPISLALAALSYHLVERPGVALGRWLTGYQLRSVATAPIIGRLSGRGPFRVLFSQGKERTRSDRN